MSGRYPRGKLNEGDEGALQLEVAAVGGAVVVKFGKPVAWIGLGPDEAMGLAGLLTKHAASIVRQIADSDTDYESVVIAHVVGRDDGWMAYRSHNGAVLVERGQCSVEPKAGEMMRLYKGEGGRIRGIVIEGRVYRYEAKR